MIKRNKSADQVETIDKGNYLIMKKVIIDIKSSQALVLERAYIRNEPMIIGGNKFIVIEASNKNGSKSERYCVNPAAILLMEP